VLGLELAKKHSAEEQSDASTTSASSETTAPVEASEPDGAQ